ncbi:MAG: hypothetical protein OQL19_08845 [Gammaproteobacteria bacterium]|nr:hypothetical protein [Gammaproteobacteria bacterium]
MKKHQRAIDKIQESIINLDLNLNNFTILTEVGSNEYIYTPIIAVLSGAKKVFAWTNDTQYGLANDNISECKRILKELNLKDKVEFFSGNFNKKHLSQADIITNSGFLRPLDKNKLKYTKSSVVIPLMYESWELRQSDIDINYCKINNIKVAGTWENHPKIMVFAHIGALAIKMALNASYEVYRNKIIVWSDDQFGETISNAFKNFYAKEVILTTDENILLKNISDTDFIFLCDYKEKKNYSLNEIFNIDEIVSLNRNIGIVHLYGSLDYQLLQEKLSIIYPKFNGKASTMSLTLAYTGLNPIINLQVAGFKVGQLLKEKKNSTLIQLIQ